MMVSLVPFKNGEVERYVLLKVVVGMIVPFVEDGFILAFVPLIELKDGVDKIDSLVPFKKVEVGRYV